VRSLIVAIALLLLVVPPVSAGPPLYTIHLDTGIYYPPQGTLTVVWTNPFGIPLKIPRVSIWGGVTIGANMDFSASLYISGPDKWLYSVGDAMNVPGWAPLAYMSFDRYGPSNGQNYEKIVDWGQFGLTLDPGQSVILQANCVDHGPNTVFGWPGTNDNCQAQAYIWFSW
jgi:hypothetical protein